jgi:hypothetical protein
MNNHSPVKTPRQNLLNSPLPVIIALCLGALACLPAAADQVIALNGSAGGKVFDGVGAVSGGGATLSVGVFRADATGVTVSPTSLTLHSGEQQTMEFTIPNNAPQGGLLLDVTTDIPESVIMPEIVVPEGANNVVITVQGGKPGAGALYLKGFGQGEITIPVAVTSK